MLSGFQCRGHVCVCGFLTAHHFYDDVVSIVAEYPFGVGCYEIGWYPVTRARYVSNQNAVQSEQVTEIGVGLS